MKHLFSILIFIFLINYSFGQDLTTFKKLHEGSASLGLSNNSPLDTLVLSLRIEKNKHRVMEQLYILLKAAEYYKVKDYQNAAFYIRKVFLRFEATEYNNLKFVVLLGSLCNTKDIEQTAENFYIANRSKLVDPECIKIINEEIRKNFPKKDFEKALSYYYYYHDRQKIIDGIYMQN